MLHRILLMFILSTVAINNVDDNTWSRFRQEYVLTDPNGNPGRGLTKEYDRVKQINVIPFLFWYCSILIFLLLEFHFVFIRSFYWCLYVSYNINYNNRISKNYRVMVTYFPDTCYTSRCGHVFVTLNDLGGKKKKNTID